VHALSPGSPVAFSAFDFTAACATRPRLTARSGIRPRARGSARSHVLGRALEHLGGDAGGALANLARGLGDGGAGVGGHAAAAGAHAVRVLRRVAAETTTSSQAAPSSAAAICASVVA